MDIAPTSLALYAAGAAAAGASLVKLKSRLELSKAKHRSLTGHARMSRLFASLVPYYEYDEGRFFRADDAPDGVGIDDEVLSALLRRSHVMRGRQCTDIRRPEESRTGGRR